MTRSAAHLVHVFHAREPYWEKRVSVDLPRAVRVRGRMKKVGYWSDKWEDKGDQYQYVHDHGPGVLLYEAMRDRGDGVSLPWGRWPGQVACLGNLWKVEFADGDAGGAILDAAVPAGTWLLAVAVPQRSSDLLVCLHPGRGFYGAIFGGRLRVRKEGIVG